MEPLLPQTGQREIVLAGGCFWGLQEYLRRLTGVLHTQVGYANGHHPGPVSYQQVCSGLTGHAEVVQTLYDPRIAPLSFLLEQFYLVIDPCSINRQGNDMGIQYRTGVYYTSSEDEALIRSSLTKLQQKHARPIAVECLPLDNYCPAETYHQDYLQKNPGAYCHISPQKMEQAVLAAPDCLDNSPPLPSFSPSLSPSSLRERLTPLQYAVTQENATEPPFQNPYWDEHRPGLYVDVTTGQPLFSAKDKFDSGCGWPSFSAPLDKTLIKELPDLSHGMVRTEVRSALGNAHLGHVFPDGPRQSGGLRYCINSASLRFIPAQQLEEEGYGAFLPFV